jgi:RNA polymerase sigma-70 factor, ECF subfamily
VRYDRGVSVGVVVLERLRAGDTAGAATQAIRQLGPRVLQYLRSLLRDEAEAGDAFSSFAEHLWVGLDGWQGSGSFESWAFRLARNAALNLRDEAWHRRVRRFATGEATALAEEVRTGNTSRLDRQRQAEALEELRRALPEEDRTLLILRVDQELSWEEISAVLSGEGEPITPNTLAQRFVRIKESLRKRAEERGLLG